MKERSSPPCPVCGSRIFEEIEESWCRLEKQKMKKARNLPCLQQCVKARCLRCGTIVEEQIAISIVDVPTEAYQIRSL